MAMHIDIVPNRNSPPAVLLRQSYREGKKVKKRTLANLSSLPMDQVMVIRQVLRGERLTPASEAFEVVRSRHHGHVQAVLETMTRLGFASVINSRPSRERNLVMTMVASRILDPHSKLETTRCWHDTTLPVQLGVEDADEDDLYQAMDWLLERQGHIERKLAARHLESGSVVLYDLSSSYFEGTTCPLASRGHNRDKKAGKLQVNYGLLTDRRGCPISVQVFEGRTGDPKTLLPQVRKVKETFGIDRMVLVGDRGMITQKQIDVLKSEDGIDWVTALRTEAIKRLVEDRSIQPELFDERNLFHFTHPDYPGERMVACRNPFLARSRGHKREDLLAATAKELEKVRGMAEKGRLRGRDKIGVRAGKVLNKYKVGKHFDLEIGDGSFSFSINQDRVAAEAALDGLYVVRTSVSETTMNASETVRTYKGLSQVERAFRTLKSIDLLIRPIYHRLENRVRAHIFLCMLAYYVRWHMLQAWRPLLFADEELDLKATRDPVAPVQPSPSARAKG
ncbi:MAG: IS1634 family transposase, partial [Deltaproteobacteria bacterium]|nr:IS1634 family transposase [Deltaproteobacteria bacterium]